MILPPAGPEISDLILRVDPRTLERLPVRREEVVETFRRLGNRQAARIVARMPATDGVLDPEAVDAALRRGHAELQRLEEEFSEGRQVLRALRPLLAALPMARPRIVDVGCGAGFIVRWLTAWGALDAELIGCDFNPALLAEARRAAALDGMDCRFVQGDAFTLEEPADVYLSTGVLHHFRGPDLVSFFARQAGAAAFLHYDIHPSWLAPFGAWIFHTARMREPLARHDGTLSAIRAHPGEALLAAARAACPDHRTGLIDESRSRFPILRVMRPVVGLRPALVAPLQRALGRRLEMQT